MTATRHNSPLLELPSAIAAQGDTVDPGIPWHHGDPFAEQRAAERGVAVVDRSNRGVLAVPGDDRLDWLHLLTSQDFRSLAEDAGTEALVLDAQGRVEHHVVAANHDGTVFLDADPGYAPSLLEYLDSMRFWSKVDPRDASEEYALLTLLGPEIDTVVAAPKHPYQVCALDGGALARRMPWPLVDTVDLLVPRESLLDWWLRLTKAGAHPAGSMAFDALRVAAVRPRLGVDTDERSIPHEARWIDDALHLHKGCYRGQETVSKVQNVGRSPRRTVLLHLDGAPEILPETGDPIFSGSRNVGRLGTVVTHHELGPIALALLKRSAPIDGELVAGVEDSAIQAAVDPDSIPPDTPAPGRVAAQGLRG